MNAKVYDSGGNELSNIDVLRCRTFPVPRMVQDRTQGGSWFVQTVGIAAVKASVELRVLGIMARDSIMTAWSSGSNITIDYDGYMRTGFIMAEPAEELVKRAEDPEQREYFISFQYAVQVEEASS